ncbi:MAG TPA: hypothetical protein VEF76_12890 [Patescibacteria group bacterium]|nr:hypothetical protein [Patescibacteria group bacterium]
MLDKWLKHFRQDNGISPEAETSPYINIEGLEGKIKVPAPTDADRQWAKKAKNATSDAVHKALGGAIAAGQNWRVWYLLNRPLKSVRTVFGRVKQQGFDGAKSLAAGIENAAAHNNVTAAYLLLKYAEFKKREEQASEDRPQPRDIVRDEVQQQSVAGLIRTADLPGRDVFALLAKTFSASLAGDLDPRAPEPVTAYQRVMMETAIRAGAEGNQAHLDAMLENRLLTPLQFVQAYMESFFFTRLYGGSDDITGNERAKYLDWLSSRMIVDHTFVEEAKTVEVRLTDAKTTADYAATQGWKPSTRDLPLQDGSLQKADDSQVEIAKLDPKDGAVMYVFNLNAGRIHRIKGGLAQEIPPSQLPDTNLLDDAKTFRDSLNMQAPALEWHKGAPVRLRFKPQ